MSEGEHSRSETEASEIRSRSLKSKSLESFRRLPPEKGTSQRS